MKAKRLSEVRITHDVPVLDNPVAGNCCYSVTGKLFFIEQEWVGGMFIWRTIKKDGTLGASDRGIWF